jgi:hypothetical protein
MRPGGVLAKALLLVGLVVSEVALEPLDMALALVGEDMGGQVGPLNLRPVRDFSIIPKSPTV